MAAPECQWYYSFRGVTEGPVPFQALCGFIAARLVPPTTYVWSPSQGGEWRRLPDVPEFAETFTAAMRGGAPAGGDGPRAFAGTPASVREEAERRPRAGLAVKAAWRWTAQALFRPFLFKRWAGVAFCSWLACTYSLVGVFDEKTLWAELQGGSKLAEAVLVSARSWALKTLAGDGVFSWCAIAFFYLVMTCFIRAKGQLMLLHRARFPGDSIQAAWTVTAGRTLPLAVFHLVADAALSVVVVGMALTVFSHLDIAVIRAGNPSGIVRAVLGDAASCEWLVSAGGVFLAVSFARSVLYHFVEPVFYRLRIPFRQAFGVTFRLFKTQLPSVLLFFCHLVAIRAAVLVAGGLLAVVVVAVGAPLFAVLPLLFPYIIRLVFLPADYFIRSLGPRFLESWKGLW